MKNSVLMACENWHKKNRSINQISEVKRFLEDEKKIENNKDSLVSIIPITRNDDKVYLQFCGWSINLYADGTWCWEDTTGG